MAPCFYFIVLLHYLLYFYCITVRFIVLYYGSWHMYYYRPRLLCIFSNLVVLLQVCYNKVEFS